MNEQIDLLANFIITEVDGEPSKNESAVECAIRIIRELTEERDEYHKRYHLACAKILSREAIIESLGDDMDKVLEELADVLEVAIARGEKLGYIYADEKYQQRLEALRPSGDESER